MIQRNPNHVGKFSIAGYIDLGWQLMQSDPELSKCKSAGHKRRFIDNSLYRFRGTDQIYVCDECKNFYHIDSSD